jgi:alkanesulfonate monooxygenase SsuD/methylene tetrahydromethanopterin reductase-like flavin-dependent oxidoreductase (luciferase family)
MPGSQPDFTHSAVTGTVGVVLPYDSPPAAFAQLAESAGFCRLASGEHLLFRRPILNAFVALAAAAGATRRIRLLSALTLLPLYPAALAAKLVSSLDVVSAGRFDFGVGIGGEVPEEFQIGGVAISERGRRTDDALLAIRELFTGEPTPGRELGQPFYSVSDLMLPKPVQEHPPIWVGGRSKHAIRRAARYGDMWLPYLMTPDQLAAGAAALAAEAEELGRGGSVGVAVSCFVCVGHDGTSAQRQAREFVARLYDVEERRVARYVVAGTIGHVVRRLQEYLEAGASTVLMNFCAEGAEVGAMAMLAGREIRPLLETRTG